MGGQDVEFSLPADEHGTRRGGGHAPSIAQPAHQESVPRLRAALQCRTSVPARMCRPEPDTTLAGMDISVHTQPSAHPVETGWVDDALASAYAAGDPLGALIGRPLTPGDGIMLVGWPEPGPGRYHLIETRPGRSAGPATYLQIVEFSGPRSEEWVAAEQRAAAGRLGPATDDIAGIVSVLRMRAADNAYLVAVLAESLDVFDVASQAIMSTDLLPGEDAAFLGGPDRISFYRLVHADLPITEGSRS